MIKEIKTYKELCEINDEKIDQLLESMIVRTLKELNAENKKEYIMKECLSQETLKKAIKENIYSYLTTNHFFERS